MQFIFFMFLKSLRQDIFLPATGILADEIPNYFAVMLICLVAALKTML